MSERRRNWWIIGMAAVLQAPFTVWVWRDLGRRSASEVRGPKWLWRATSANTTGCVAYVVVGRRRREPGRPEHWSE